MTRRKFLTLSALTAASVGVIGVAESAPQKVRRTRYQISWPGVRGLRVAHITDLHVGWGTPKHLLKQTLALTRAARPHLVVLTGDYLNHSLKRLPDLERFIAALPCPCVATLGNHDHWSDPDAIQRSMERLGVVVLRNSNITMRLAGRSLPVVGVDDGLTRHHDVERSFAGLEHPQRALVLSHYAETADEIVQRGGRLILAGHTHGGQFNLPILTTAVTRMVGMQYVAGWYPVGQGRLYVNAGIGSMVIRRRIGRRAIPEVALMDLI